MSTGRARKPKWHGPGGKPGRKARNLVITTYGWYLLQQMDRQSKGGMKKKK